eukprot:scaffold128621_cov20-Prasinocladus_malaysianus.AAC.1
MVIQNAALRLISRCQIDCRYIVVAVVIEFFFAVVVNAWGGRLVVVGSDDKTSCRRSIDFAHRFIWPYLTSSLSALSISEKQSNNDNVKNTIMRPRRSSRLSETLSRRLKRYASSPCLPAGIERHPGGGVDRRGADVATSMGLLSFSRGWRRVSEG